MSIVVSSQALQVELTSGVLSKIYSAMETGMHQDPRSHSEVHYL